MVSPLKDEVGKQGNNNVRPFLTIWLFGFVTWFCTYLRIPVLPLLASSMGGNSAEIGTINGAFMLTAGLLSVPAGLLIDRVGAKPPAIAGLTALAVSSLLISICQVPLQMMGAYVIFGIGMAFFGPSMLALIGSVTPTNRMGQSFGLFTAGIFTAQTLGPASGGFLGEVLGYRQVFTISGTILVAIILLTFFFLPKGPSEHNTKRFRAVLSNGLMLLRSPRLVAAYLAMFGASIGFAMFLTFLPLHASEKSLDSSQIGLVFAIQALAQVVVRPLIGKLSDRIDNRILVIIGLVFLAGGLIFLGQASTLVYMLAWAFVLGLGMAIAVTTIVSMISKLVPGQQRGLAMGMFLSSFNLGMMSGSITMGITLKHFAFSTGFAIAGFMVTATSMLFILIVRR